MPRRNVRDRRKRGPHHSYNRARAGRALFRSDADRDFFVDLIASRTSRSKFRSPDHRRASVVLGAEVAAMCLMTTHFHLIVWQHENEAMRRLLQSILTGYVRYYNRKYGLSGPLFSGPFRSRHLDGDREVRWAIAYVHANHPSGPDYRFSTHGAYIDDHKRPGWLAADRGLAAFGDESDYVDFMKAHASRAELNARFF